MSEPEFYVAPCWSIKRIVDITSEEEQLAMIVFGKEMSRDKGLKFMERKGWQLARIQDNQHPPSSHLPSWLQPDYYYVFTKGNSKKPKIVRSATRAATH